MFYQISQLELSYKTIQTLQSKEKSFYIKKYICN
jgi:hypothetical protein